MSAKYKLNIIAYCIFVIVTSYLISLALNPDRLIINKYQNDFFTPAVPTFFKLSELKPSSELDLESAKQFRGGIKRQGFYKVSKNPDFSNVLSTKSLTLNHGFHSASKSSPIESKNFIIVAGDQGLIQILNKKNHSLHWKIQLFDSNRGVHSTPLTFSDYAIIGDYTGKVYFLDLKNKKIIWVSDWGDAIGASPLLIGEHLYLNVEHIDPQDGFLAKINILTTKVEWVTPYLGQQSHSSIASDGEHLFFGNNNGTFFKINKNNGSTIWSKEFNKPIKSTPAVVNDLVIFSDWNGYLNALNNETGKLEWSLSLDGKANQSSVAVSKNKALGLINYFKGIKVFNLKTGALIKDYKLDNNSQNSTASPIIVSYKNNESALTSCEGNHICIINLSNLNLKKIQLSSSDGFSNQMTPINNKFYIAPEKDSSLLYTN